MSKQENVIIMLNKLRTARTVKNLEEESDVLYKELVQTRKEMISLQENMEKEIFNIIKNIKTLKDNNKIVELSRYIDAQYEILKNDLSEDYQSNRQAIIKILM